MEWDRVVVFGVTAGLIPHRLALDVEEERRVLHVAITRARRRAVLLTDAGRPSPFLAELDGSASHDRQLVAVARDPSAAAPVAGARRPLEPLPAEAEAPEAALRAWRLERSRRDKVPAYVVLSDRHLQGIAIAPPRVAGGAAGAPGHRADQARRLRRRDPGRPRAVRRRRLTLRRHPPLPLRLAPTRFARQCVGRRFGAPAKPDAPAQPRSSSSATSRAGAITR